MDRLLLSLLTIAVMGCSPSMKVQVSPIPTVVLNSTSVAVIAKDRTCRSIADELVEVLRNDYEFEIEPSSPIRLRLSDCNASYSTNVTITETDTVDNLGTSHRKLAMVGRGYASLTVTTFGQDQSHSIGTGQQENVFGRHAENLVTLKRLTEGNLNHRVAEDLASQVSPVPKEVARRIFPNASDDSARGLHTQAVRAEAQGYLVKALEFAVAAHNQRPTSISRAYVVDLDRRVQHLQQGSQK